VNNPVNIAISFVLLIAVVGGSFFYVSSRGTVELPPEPWIGITDGLIIMPAAAEALGLNQNHGLLIYTIAPASPADKAGLRGATNVTIINGQQIPTGGDIVVRMDDKEISSPEDVCAVLAQKQVGDNISFVIDRNGDVMTVDLIVERLPPQATTIC
jgi:S1-C subfamily serine protease